MARGIGIDQGLFTRAIGVCTPFQRSSGHVSRGSDRAPTEAGIRLDIGASADVDAIECVWELRSVWRCVRMLANVEGLALERDRAPMGGTITEVKPAWTR